MFSGMSAFPDMPPEPSRFPKAPAPKCFLSAFAITSLLVLLLFRRCMLLWLVSRLPRGVMLVVFTLLVHSAAAYRKFTLARFGMFYRLRGRRRSFAPAVRHVRLAFKNPQLLFVGFGTLHFFLLSINPRLLLRVM